MGDNRPLRPNRLFLKALEEQRNQKKNTGKRSMSRPPNPDPPPPSGRQQQSRAVSVPRFLGPSTTLPPYAQFSHTGRPIVRGQKKSSFQSASGSSKMQDAVPEPKKASRLKPPPIERPPEELAQLISVGLKSTVSSEAVDHGELEDIIKKRLARRAIGVDTSIEPPKKKMILKRAEPPVPNVIVNPGPRTKKNVEALATSIPSKSTELPSVEQQKVPPKPMELADTKEEAKKEVPGAPKPMKASFWGSRGSYIRPDNTSDTAKSETDEVVPSKADERKINSLAIPIDSDVTTVGKITNLPAPIVEASQKPTDTPIAASVQPLEQPKDEAMDIVTSDNADFQMYVAESEPNESYSYVYDNAEPIYTSQMSNVGYGEDQQYVIEDYGEGVNDGQYNGMAPNQAGDTLTPFPKTNTESYNNSSEAPNAESYWLTPAEDPMAYYNFDSYYEYGQNAYDYGNMEQPSGTEAGEITEMGVNDNDGTNIEYSGDMEVDNMQTEAEILDSFGEDAITDVIDQNVVLDVAEDTGIDAEIADTANTPVPPVEIVQDTCFDGENADTANTKVAQAEVVENTGLDAEVPDTTNSEVPQIEVVEDSSLDAGAADAVNMEVPQAEIVNDDDGISDAEDGATSDDESDDSNVEVELADNKGDTDDEEESLDSGDGEDDISDHDVPDGTKDGENHEDQVDGISDSDDSESIDIEINHVDASVPTTTHDNDLNQQSSPQHFSSDETNVAVDESPESIENSNAVKNKNPETADDANVDIEFCATEKDAEPKQTEEAETIQRSEAMDSEANGANESSGFFEMSNVVEDVIVKPESEDPMETDTVPLDNGAVTDADTNKDSTKLTLEKIIKFRDDFIEMSKTLDKCEETFDKANPLLRTSLDECDAKLNAIAESQVEQALSIARIDKYVEWAGRKLTLIAERQNQSLRHVFDLAKAANLNLSKVTHHLFRENPPRHLHITLKTLIDISPRLADLQGAAAHVVCSVWGTDVVKAIVGWRAEMFSTKSNEGFVPVPASLIYTMAETMTVLCGLPDPQNARLVVRDFYNAIASGMQIVLDEARGDRSARPNFAGLLDDPRYYD